MTCVTRPCWKLVVYKGHWMVKSTHDTPAAAMAARRAAQRDYTGTRIVESTRKVATWVQPPPPTEARRFREQQADNMVLHRQANQYFKSGCNGTELVALPKKEGDEE